ncbi:MAG: Transcriptional regulator, TetR family [Myxococcaceae bacterium]|nr:Transcriptional regulator, TetR family [Myxococcaceae bacterium]
MKYQPVTALPTPLTLFEQKQESVRHAICDQACKLLFEQGFHQTTIDDIAKAAGIGRRTFFRYFETKEDLVLWEFDQFARHTVYLLGKRPAKEAGLQALQRALTEASEFYNQQPTQTLSILQLVEATPSLYAQQLLQQERWKSWFAEGLRARTRASSRSVLPEMTAAVALEAMAIAVRRWVASPGTSLSDSITTSFGSLKKVLTPRAERA